MKKSIIIIIFVVFVIVIFSGLYFQSSQKPAEPEEVSAENTEADDQSNAIWIEVKPAVSGDISVTVSETDITAPVHSVTISSEVAGRLIKIDGEIGKKVQKQELIARIDDELYSLAVDQAQAQFINAKAAYEKAQKDIERYRILLEKEEISEGEFEVNRLQHEQAKAAYLSSEASVKTTERQLRNSRITSPITGEIAVKYVEEGNMITINQSIVKVVDISKIKVRINLSELDIINVRAGMPVTILIDAFPDKKFNGTVAAIGPEANQETHTFPVEIIVPNNQAPMIRSGMIARVSIETQVLHNVTLVPMDALVERYGKDCVFVVENGKARECDVVLGATSGSFVQIVDGVQPGELVVVVGQFGLEDGAPVRIRDR